LPRGVLVDSGEVGGKKRMAGFPARKAVEEFNFDHQPSLKRDIIAHLSTSVFIDKAQNPCCAVLRPTPRITAHYPGYHARSATVADLA
jgi:hypothetical protein